MIDFKRLIDYLPSYYREADTYKDDKGIGILEKFLEIFGKYLEENIKQPIDEALDTLINVSESKDNKYLKYLWRWFGEFPLINSEDPLILNLTTKEEKDILKYVTSLYKIRGTEKFYQIVFNLYSNSINQLKLISIDQVSPDWKKDFRDKTIPRSKTNPTELWPYFDMSSYDSDDYFDSKKEMSFIGYTTFKVEVNKYLAPMIKIWRVLKAFIDRFLPFNIKSKLILNNQDYDKTSYHFKVSLLTGNKWVSKDSGTVIQLEDDESVFLKVELFDNYNRKIYDLPWYSDMLYTKGQNKAYDQNFIQGFSEKSKYYGDRVISINGIFMVKDGRKDIRNTYRFYLDDPSKAFTITISSDKYSRTYYYIIRLLEYEKVYDGETPITIKVEAYKLIDDKKYKVHVVFKNSGSIQESNDSNHYITSWKVTSNGTYEFYLSEALHKKVLANVEKLVPRYRVLLGYSYIKVPNTQEIDIERDLVNKLEEKNSEIYIDTPLELLHYANVKVYIEPIAPTKKVPSNIMVNIVGTNTHLRKGDIWNPFGYDTYTFSIENNDSGKNESAKAIIYNSKLAVDLMRVYSLDPSNNKDEITDSKPSAICIVSYLILSEYSKKYLKEHPDKCLYTITCPNGKIFTVGIKANLEKEIYKTVNINGDEVIIEAIQENNDLPKLKIVSKKPGFFYVTTPLNNEALVKWNVVDRRNVYLEAAALYINPIGNYENWLGISKSEAGYISNSNTTGPFTIRLVDKKGWAINDISVSFWSESLDVNTGTIKKEVVTNGQVLRVSQNTTFVGLYHGKTFKANVKLLNVKVIPNELTWLIVDNEILTIDGIEDPVKDLIIDASSNLVKWSLEKK